MSPRARLFVRVAIGVVVVGVLLIGLDTREVLDRLASTNLGLAAMGISGLVAIHLLGAATWRRLVGHLAGVRLPSRDSIAVYYTAQAVGGITPGNLGGDAYRIYALMSTQSTAARVWPVVIQRATSLASLTTIAAVALIPLWNYGPWGAQMIVVAFVIITSAAAVGFVLVKAAARVGVANLSNVPRVQLMRALRDGYVLGLAFHGAGIVLTYLLVQAVAPGSLSLIALSAVAVARLATAVPVTPSGLGVQEALLAVLFAATGLDPAVALAALILARCSLVLTAIVGVLCLIARRTTPVAVHREQRPAIPQKIAYQ